MSESVVDLSQLPPDLAAALKKLDKDGNGVSVEEVEQAAAKFDASAGASDGFPLIAFPKNLHSILEVFDKDGDGHVGKAELAMAAQLYKESKDQQRKLQKIVLALALIILLMLLAIMGLVYVVVEMTKETQTGESGVMTAKGSMSPVRVDTVESFSSIWDIPGVDTTTLAYMKSITFVVDMASVPNMGMTEATFKVSGAYKPSGSTQKAFLTTPEGFIIEIDRQAKNGSVTMGELGEFNIFAEANADTRRLEENELLVCSSETCVPQAMPEEWRSRRLFGGGLVTSGSFSMMASGGM